MAIILILDDSATNRSIYARLATLVEEGVAIEAFADPVDALEWLGHNRVDLIISDFRMPSMDGAAFTRQLRSIAGCATLPVLIVTAHDDRSYRVRALDAGATDFLQSPIDHIEFVARARNLLALSQRGTVPQAGLPEAGRPATEGEALSRILDTMPVMLSATDWEGRCVYANSAFAVHCGANPAEILGVPASLLLGPGRAAWNRAADHAVFASGQALSNRREEFTDDAGTPRIILTSKTPLRDPEGRVDAVLTTSVEIPPHALAASAEGHP
jgi:PAS domain S-box-containing protein